MPEIPVMTFFHRHKRVHCRVCLSGLARAHVKRGQRRERLPPGFDRAPLSAVSAASACERTALRFAKQQGAIATQSNGVERSRSGD